MNSVFVRKVILSDFSFFWRGECNGCDWIDESLCNPDIHSKAQVHLRVLHNGGTINHANYKVEVKGK